MKIWDTSIVPSDGFIHCLATLEHGSSGILLHVIQLANGRVVSGSPDALKIWNIDIWECMMFILSNVPRTSEMKIFQLNEGIIPDVSFVLTHCPVLNDLTLWNIATITEQRWKRRRLFLLIAKYCRTDLRVSLSFRKLVNLQSGDSSKARFVLVESIASML